MKTELKKVSLAIAGVLASSMAFAQDDNSTSGSYIPGDINAANDTYVSVYKDVNNSKYVDVAGSVTVKGTITVNSQNQSVIDNKQFIHHNSVENPSDPTATANVNTVNTNKGNVGVNAAAGNINQQDNAAAISASDNDTFWANTDAESFVRQGLDNNEVTLVQPTYVANVTSVNGNEGNVGVNATAGNLNQQKNALAVATGVTKNNSLTEADAVTLQESYNLKVSEASGGGTGAGAPAVPVVYAATVGDVSANAGNIGVNVSAGNFNQQSNSLNVAAWK